MDFVFEWKRPALLSTAGKNSPLTRAVFRSLKMAGRDGIRTARTDFAKYVRQRKRFKAGRVREALRIQNPKTNEIDGLVWKMHVSGKAMPLSTFPHRQTKRGVSVAVNVGKRKLIKGAFVATMKSGHKGIFQREASGESGPQTKRKSKSTDFFRVARLPIAEQFSTRVSDVLRDAGEAPALFARASQVFSATFDRTMPLNLERFKAG